MMRLNEMANKQYTQSAINNTVVILTNATQQFW